METIRFLPTPIKFDERSVKAILEDPDSKRIAERVQLLRTGIFNHPRLGELKITRSMIENMIHNFENKVRGVDLAIDYKHDSDDVAAGWIKSLDLAENPDDPTYVELWAEVSWTPTGLKKLAEKEFRYLSADFSLDYQDNESLEKFGPTLFGAGLTNRPVVKRMAPAVELTELKGEKMKVEDLKKEIDDLKVKLADEETKTKNLNVKLGEYEQMEKKLQEFEMTPEQMMAKIKELMAKIEELEGAKAEMAKEAELSEKERKFDVLLSEGKVVEAQRKSYLEDDMKSFVELAGQVNLSEKGSGKEGKKDKIDGETVEDRVLELAEKKAKEESIALGDAISLVLSENAELKKEYEKQA